MAPHLVGLAVDCDAALGQQHRAVTEALHRSHVVGDQDDRTSALAQVIEDVEALLLEGGVPTATPRR